VQLKTDALIRRIAFKQDQRVIPCVATHLHFVAAKICRFAFT
jgi:hypothetical protein